MNITSRFHFGTAQDRGTWMIASLLLLAVLVPTACLIYFMNVAVNQQRVVANRMVGQAFQGELRLLAERVNTIWYARVMELDRHQNEAPARAFEHSVREGLADSVIIFGRDGWPAYPSLAAPPGYDPTLRSAEWTEARRLENSGQADAAAQKYQALAKDGNDPASRARAAQAHIRCLAARGRKSEAINAIETYFQQPQMAEAASPDGRLILPDELLLELQLRDPGKARNATAKRLFDTVQNYGNPMPSSQRLFLMNQLCGMKLEQQYWNFPTYQAERLAERLLSEGRTPPNWPMQLRTSGVPDVWETALPSRRAVGFYHTQSVVKAINDSAKPLGSGSRFSILVTPPGQPVTGVSGTINGALGDWRISIPKADAAQLNVTAQRQVASYLWIGFLALATVAVLAVVGAQILRRQMKIAHLKTDLVAAVSHELKTPLASMKLLVESLLSGKELEPTRTREYLEMVARENSRLSRLIDNFLTFSRMERNRGRFDFAQVNPEAVARAAVESVGDRFPVELAVADGLPYLWADEDALVTVLLNLLDNAFKYSGDNRRVQLHVGAAAGRVTFAVSDNGIGIAVREQKRIFRRFYQVNRALSRQTGGVGLGLSIVEFIVNAHHGSVSVTSRPGEGSTFTVSLPPSVSAREAAA